MAKQVITMMTDDIDGSPADTTVTFGYEGGLYTIDLSAKNAKEFEDLMARYVASGERHGRLSPTGTYMTGGSGPRRGVDHPNFAGNRELNQKIRAWAAKNNYMLAERGRIPQHIVDAYHKGISNPDAGQDALPFSDGDAEPEPQVPDEPVETKIQAARARKVTASKATPAKTAPVKATRTRQTA